MLRAWRLASHPASTPIIVQVIHGQTLKERADREIRALAMIDSLTGTFNWRVFMARTEKKFAIQ